MSNSPIIYGGSNSLGLTLLPPTSSGAVTADTLGNIGNIGIGVASGLATLDASGKIPASELPSTLLEYQGLWNPATNTPTLQDSTGTNGYTYQVSMAYAGPIIGLSNATMVNFQVGNLVIYSSAISQWEQVGAASGVTSVNGAQGAVTVNAINQLTGDITAGPASGSESEVASLVATANSTLVTLSALSLPYSQVTGTPTFADSLVNTSGTVTLVNDISNLGNGSHYDYFYGTNALASVGYFQLPIGTAGMISSPITSITPMSPGTVALGATNEPFSNTYSNSFYVYDNFGDNIGSITETNNGITLGANFSSGSFVGALALMTANNSSGNSGDITLTTGTATATRGSIQFIDGSQGTSGDIWVSKDTSGSGNWVASIPGSQVTGNISGNAANVTGDVVVANGGTGVATLTPYALVTGGTTSTGAVQQVTTLGTAGQGLISNGASALPTFQTFVGATLVAPTISKATASGTGTGGFGNTQQGWLFNISTSSTCSVGDTYTNNSNTYIVQAALSAQSGQVLFMSGTGTLSGTTLTRSSGSGTSSITFTNTGTNPLNPIATYLYTVPTSPRQPLFIEVQMIGGGSGGTGGNSGSQVGGGAGQTTVFGTLFVATTGGASGSTYFGGSGGVVNTVSPWQGSTAILPLVTIPGSVGGGFGNTTQGAGGMGGSSPFGGAGGGAADQQVGGNAVANTGSGGGGASSTGATGGGGGGSGGYANFIIPQSNLAATYLYTVGSGGAGGAATLVGGNGASGVIIIKEYYQ